MKKKYILSFVSVGTVFFIVLGLISRLVEPKYLGASREGNLISEYYRALDAGERHDVIFIGDCEAYSSFVPPVLYEKYGIRSFVRASPSQSIAQSYYLLCETLNYEKPQAVVFSVYALCREDRPREAYNRMTLDGMRLSPYKIAAVRGSVNDGESVLFYYMPLLRFHSRIYELSGDDLRYIFTRPSVSHNGYLMKKGVIPPDRGLEDDNEALAALPRENFEYLAGMAKKCRESGVRLILVKPPTASWRYPWYQNWNAEIEKWAETEGISFYAPSAESCKIDMNSDSYDGGLHLNVRGAEKVTEYFGAILSGEIGTATENDSVWKDKLEKYYCERNK